MIDLTLFNKLVIYANHITQSGDNFNGGIEDERKMWKNKGVYMYMYVLHSIQ